MREGEEVRAGAGERFGIGCGGMAMMLGGSFVVRPVVGTPRATGAVTSPSGAGARRSVATCAWPKVADARAKGDEELVKGIAEGKRKLLDLRFARAFRTEYKAHEFQHTKMMVAQYNTVLRERQIEAGISNRTMRLAKKRAKAGLPPK